MLFCSPPPISYRKQISRHRSFPVPISICKIFSFYDFCSTQTLPTVLLHFSPDMPHFPSSVPSHLFFPLPKLPSLRFLSCLQRHLSKISSNGNIFEFSSWNSHLSGNVFFFILHVINICIIYLVLALFRSVMKLAAQYSGEEGMA